MIGRRDKTLSYSLIDRQTVAMKRQNLFHGDIDNTWPEVVISRVLITRLKIISTRIRLDLAAQ